MRAARILGRLRLLVGFSRRLQGGGERVHLDREVVKTATDEAGLAAALSDVRAAVLGEQGIGEDDLTTEQYTDAVMRARA